MGPKKNQSVYDDAIARRDLINTNLARFENFVLSCDGDSSKIPELKLRLKKFEQLWDQFDEIQTAIELSPIAITAHEQGVRMTFENDYFRLASAAEAIISKTAPAVATNNARSQHDLFEECGVKLQPISIPKYNGNYEDWLAFSDIFKSMIHLNDKIPPLKKFYCLRNSLTGVAEGVIKNIEVTEGNYAGAWELLEKRFHNVKLITEKHVKALFDLPKVQRECGKELRSLLDNTQKHLQALETLNQPVDYWDTLLIHLLSSKFDPDTFKAWQEASPSTELPSFDDFLEFLTRRAQILESLPSKPTTSHQSPNSGKQNKGNESKGGSMSSKASQFNNACMLAQQQDTCALCKGSHIIFRCRRFLNLAPEARVKTTLKLNLCTNCLRSPHGENGICPSRKCPFCPEFHNSLLHIDKSAGEEHSSIAALLDSPSKPVTSTVTHTVGHTDNQSSNIILSTAMVNIISATGYPVGCRVLLDCGSQSNFITDSACKLLGLKRVRNYIPVGGINATTTQISHKVTATMKSRVSDYCVSAEWLVVPVITGRIPATPLKFDSDSQPADVVLADPLWNSPGGVDALIGAQYFWDILLSERVEWSVNQTVLQNTQLGYIVCGSSEYTGTDSASLCHIGTLNDLDKQIEAFWKIEEPSSSQRIHTGEDKACETHFSRTVSRDIQGRYTVQFPLKLDVSVLGNSRNAALRQFKSLESRLIKQPDLYKQYKDFMYEYERLGHMKEVPNIEEAGEYFIPHHAVRKESSTTTKLRVVFNASAKSDSGYSLNDTQMVGPTIQDGLFDILIRFRMNNYVVIADIEKMYRQTWIHPSQTKLQKIFWRDNPLKEIKVFELLTVTYGTTSAPFLATRSLLQLFKDESPRFPNAFPAYKDFYVDNYMSGFSTIEEGLETQDELIKMFHAGGLHLRKWASNTDQLLEPISIEDRELLETYHFDELTSTTVKSLGLVFDTQDDSFIFSIKPATNVTISKREVISEIAQIFDPLGLIGPIILQAKIFMQQLWRLGLGWDENLPSDLSNDWDKFRKSLPLLGKVKIPRQVTVTQSNSKLELHAFSDASEVAYGTCIYLRTSDDIGNVLGVNLLCSKSRVAPLKTVSVPRLELCGALLMTQVTQIVKLSLNCTTLDTYYWTDSTVVLAWISAPSSHWATFVSNRVAKIQDVSNSSQWNHVAGCNNPADLISRGADVTQLSQSELWWHGPSFLLNNIQPQLKCAEEYACLDPPERKKPNTISLHLTIKDQFPTLFRFSNFDKLVRIIALCNRFIHNCKIQKVNACQRNCGFLTSRELEAATNIVLHNIQRDHFHQELKLLQCGKELPHTSKLAKLSPYICEDNLLRVGGRINHAHVKPDQKHPVILPSNHHITKMIATNYHVKHLHCGPQTLLATMRMRYWPLNGRFLVNNVVQNCVRCFKVKPTSSSQLMGQLPEARVSPSRPFTHCGIDYAGPIHVRLSNLRRPVIGKAYVASFVCFSTKAIHIELVEDLSTEALLSALRRFASRRGIPACIYSDNASNFKGASSQLQEIQRFLEHPATQREIAAFSATNGIQWKFIPPYSPTVGGLWEASIKRIKFHLRRMMGSHVLTYVDLNTLLCQIEACINSRPLTPLSNDPSDLTALTPAHFLIGDSLIAFPEANLPDLPVNRLKRYQLVQRLRQHFWSRWSLEYISELQSRSKWSKTHPNLQPGTLVLLKDNQLPPLQWKLGRIVAVTQGRDNLTRVVSVKTDAGVTQRSITKLCPLPIDYPPADNTHQDSA